MSRKASSRPPGAPHPPAPDGDAAKAGARHRRAILKAATKLFARHGFAGTTIEAIAQEAGLPRANVYYYFASKEEIYRTILGDIIGAWDAATDWIVPDADPAQALARYVEAKLAHARRNATESRLFALEILGGARFLTKGDRAHMRASTRRGAAVVEGWIEAGKLNRVDPRHLFILLWSATQFYADFTIAAADALDQPRLSRRDFKAAADTIVAIVLHGISPPAVAP